MKMGQQRQGRHRIAIQAIALLGMLFLFYVMGRLALHFVPSLGLAPCEDSDGPTQAAYALEAGLIVVGIWLHVRVDRRPSYALLIAAILTPLAVWLLQNAVNDRDALRQRQCAARPLAEAMTACGANPEYYRREQRSAYDVLTVIAPGTTDREHACLSQWSVHNGTVSMKVDESVYREYRERHSKRD